GNGRQRTEFSSAASPNTFAVIHQKTAGRVTHYVNIYGSVLDKASNWKVVPGITAAFKAKQTSFTATLKLESRF
ncbi:MAG: hypothetical protein Q8K36_01055, partial [Alphaproteobacteria bacterium]|nr:hypothetical protein [Alphaproteobacteria bacterium]